mgnify:CR=1 FL=1
MREMAKRPFIAGSSMWNLNDFYSESRIDAVPHVNNKGIVGLNREKKDTYLFYQASLSKQPYLMIGQREWMARGGAGKCDKNATNSRKTCLCDSVRPCSVCFALYHTAV